jgi:hypothetical protein
VGNRQQIHQSGHIDPNGGNNFVDAGTNQLLSVPYAIYADKAGVAANGGTDKTRTGAVNSEAAHVAGDNRYLTRFYGLNLIGKSALYESAAGNIGLGTIAPGGKFSIYANSATNFEHLRLQNVSATGSGKFIMYNDGLSFICYLYQIRLCCCRRPNSWIIPKCQHP